MTLYRYVKAQPTTVYPQVVTLPTKPKSLFLTIIPFLLMTTGFILIASIATPILYHLLVVFPRNQKLVVISPLPTTLLEIQQLAQVAGVTTDIPSQISAPLISKANSRADYLKASNWFPTAPIARPSQSKITHYTISIPKLKVFNAVVEIGGNDLKSSLVQYAETANPGEFGSPVIFGHSILRQFYNPSEKNPKRYISIFSTIMTLEPGDEISVNFDGIQYEYKVAEKYEVTPTQVEVLQQRYNRQSLKLITCTPEGTYLRRGVIDAQLVQKT